MRPRTLLVLLLLVVGLAAVIWLEREVPTTEERVEQEKKVLPMEEDEVTEIVLEHGEQRIHLVRPAKEASDDDSATGGEVREWQIVEPVLARADRFAVDGLLAAIANLEKERTLAEGGDRSEYGLEPPASRITVVRPPGSRTLELGGDLPASSSRIAAIAGEPALYVVPKTLETQLDKAPGDWRDKQLFTGTRGDVERLRIDREAGSVLLAKRGEDSYWIEAPLTDRADPDQVNRLLGDLTGLRAEQFADQPPPLEEIGLAPPSAVLEVVLSGQQEPFRVEWGGPVEGAERSYARVAEQVVEVNSQFGESLQRSAGDWRSRAWASMRSYEVDRLAITDVDGELALARADGDWKRGDETLSFSTVSDLLYAITGARADRLFEGAEAPKLGEPTTTIVLATDKGVEERLLLYAGTADGLPARTEGREVTLLLPTAAAAEIAEKIAAVRSAKEESADDGEDLGTEPDGWGPLTPEKDP